MTCRRWQGGIPKLTVTSKGSEFEVTVFFWYILIGEYEGEQEEETENRFVCAKKRRRGISFRLWHVIVFEEPNPTESRPRDR